MSKWYSTIEELRKMVNETIQDVEKIEGLLNDLNCKQEWLYQELGEEECINILKGMNRSKDMLMETRHRYIENIEFMKDIIVRIEDVCIPPQR